MILELTIFPLWCQKLRWDEVQVFGHLKFYLVVLRVYYILRKMFVIFVTGRNMRNRADIWVKPTSQKLAKIGKIAPNSQNSFKMIKWSLFISMIHFLWWRGGIYSDFWHQKLFQRWENLNMRYFWHARHSDDWKICHLDKYFKIFQNYFLGFVSSSMIMQYSYHGSYWYY